MSQYLLQVTGLKVTKSAYTGICEHSVRPSELKFSTDKDDINELYLAQFQSGQTFHFRAPKQKKVFWWGLHEHHTWVKCQLKALIFGTCIYKRIYLYIII